jgi:hypothetical protein
VDPPGVAARRLSCLSPYEARLRPLCPLPCVRLHMARVFQALGHRDALEVTGLAAAFRCYLKTIEAQSTVAHKTYTQCVYPIASQDLGNCVWLAGLLKLRVLPGSPDRPVHCGGSICIRVSAVLAWRLL